METLRQRYKKFFKEHPQPCRVNLMIDLDEAVIRVDLYTRLLYNLFNQCKSKIKNNNFTVEEICNRLNKQFIKLKIQFIENGIKTPYGITGAHTDADTYNTITVKLNTGCLPHFKLYEDSYVDNLIDYIEHELVHREQAIRMKSQEIIEQEFLKDRGLPEDELANMHELMAYAFFIIEESRMGGWDDIKIIKNLKQFKSNSRIFNEYLKYFDADSDTMKTLVKYMYQYLDQ